MDSIFDNTLGIELRNVYQTELAKQQNRLMDAIGSQQAQNRMYLNGVFSRAGSLGAYQSALQNTLYSTGTFAYPISSAPSSEIRTIEKLRAELKDWHGELRSV